MMVTHEQDRKDADIGQDAHHQADPGGKRVNGYNGHDT